MPYIDNSANSRAFARIDRRQKWCPLFPAMAGGHMLTLGNHSFYPPAGSSFHGAAIYKTLAKTATKHAAVQQSTCSNCFLPPTQPPFNPS